MDDIFMKTVQKHFARAIERDRYKYSILQKKLPKNIAGIYLEAGSGTNVTYVTDKNHVVCAIDIVPEMIKNLLIKNSSVIGIIGSVVNIPFRDNTVSIISSKQVLHHLVSNNKKGCLRSIQETIREFNRIMIGNGMILIYEIIINNFILRNFIFFVTKFCEKHNVEIEFLYIRSGVITYFLTEKEFLEICNENGLNPITLSKKTRTVNNIPLGYNFTYMLK